MPDAALEMLGFSSEEELDATIAGLGPSERAELLYVLDGEIGDIDDGRGTEVFEAKLPNSIDNIKAAHRRAMDSASEALEKGNISLGEYNRRVHDSIDRSFRDAYEKGIGRPLDAGDNEYLRRSIGAEMGYAEKFGRDIQEKRLRMPRERRVAMYAETVDSQAWHGMVESWPDEARIYWRLGPAEHCQDCLVLSSSSPFSKYNLPTTPRAGGTRCFSNCKCRLEVSTGRLTKKEKEDADEYGWRKDASLADMLAQPEPPKGFRSATVDERTYIDSLWASVNANRRIIALSSKADEVKAAIMARKAANAELIEFLEKEGIYDVPLWSVDDVIDGRHIGRAAEADIFGHGIDGETLDMLSQKQIENLVRRYEQELAEKFEELDIYGKPDFKEWLRKKYKVPKAEAEGKGEWTHGEYTLVATNMPDTIRLAPLALVAARGKKVRVGPLSDRLIQKAYVWVKGDPADVAEVMESLTKIAGERKIGFVAVPVELHGRER